MPDAPTPVDAAMDRVGWDNRHLARRLQTGWRTIDRLKHDPHPDLLTYLETIARLIEAVPVPYVKKRAPMRKRG